MGRGRGKYSNHVVADDHFYSERWSRCEAGGISWFESANHAMQVKHIGGDKYRIYDARGNELRGKNHGLRTFGCPIKAMIEADKVAKEA